MEFNTVGRAAHIVHRQRGKRYSIKKFNDKQKEAGICYYLYDKGLVAPQTQHTVIRAYALYRKWALPSHREIVEICILIQKDFPSFREWFLFKFKIQNNVEAHLPVSADTPILSSSEGTV